MPRTALPAGGVAAARHSPSAPSTPTTPDALPPGSRLDGYDIDSVLESNGFSVLYLATDRRDARIVAIEEYLPGPLATRGADLELQLRSESHASAFERGMQAYIDEAQWLASCEHPALPRVRRWWRANGTVYREMPYLRGTTLRRLRDSMGEPPSEPALRALLDGVLGALACMHENGRMHGAVSPDTILLCDGDDAPLLLGHNAARRAIVGNEAQALMQLVGLVYAPDERRGDPNAFLPSSDVYALAGTVRFCIDGRVENQLVPSGLTAFEPPETLSQSAARLAFRYPGVHYSAPFLAAIEWGLTRRADERPKTIAEFQAALSKKARRGAPWLGGDPKANGRVEPHFESGFEPTRPGDVGMPSRWSDEPLNAAPRVREPRRVGHWVGALSLSAVAVVLTFLGWELDRVWRANEASNQLAKVAPGIVTESGRIRRPDTFAARAAAIDETRAALAVPAKAAPASPAVPGKAPVVVGMPAATVAAVTSVPASAPAQADTLSAAAALLATAPPAAGNAAPAGTTVASTSSATGAATAAATAVAKAGPAANPVNTAVPAGAAPTAAPSVAAKPAADAGTSALAKAAPANAAPSVTAKLSTEPSSPAAAKAVPAIAAATSTAPKPPTESGASSVAKPAPATNVATATSTAAKPAAEPGSPSAAKAAAASTMAGSTLAKPATESSSTAVAKAAPAGAAPQVPAKSAAEPGSSSVAKAASPNASSAKATRTAALAKGKATKLAAAKKGGKATTKLAAASTAKHGATAARGRTVSAAASDPLAACAKRPQSAQYRCVQAQCTKPQWRGHYQCSRLHLIGQAD